LLEALAPFRTGSYERRALPARREPEARAEVLRAPRKSHAGSIAGFLAALAFVVAGTWATKHISPEQALEKVSATLQEPELASSEPALEQPAPKVRAIEAVADARAATKVARASREPARVASAARRKSPALDTPASVPGPDPLPERPITIERLSNGLIDPFGAR
ncbi:MAG TPA: hypothetical protein VJR89_08880, partial [Polyangiales bacterium]|nr:hypothetical protein [Polyangiales bacterium]